MKHQPFAALATHLPVLASQLSSVHAYGSLQSLAVPVQLPALQASLMVHALLSLQLVPSASAVSTQQPALQMPLLHEVLGQSESRAQSPLWSQVLPSPPLSLTLPSLSAPSLSAPSLAALSLAALSPKPLVAASPAPLPKSLPALTSMPGAPNCGGAVSKAP